MENQTIRIATRKSQLALWQAEHVKKELLELHPQLTIELVGITTQGDKILDTTLSKIGGKGLFIKELENALLDGRADIAVHSVKDMPGDISSEFCLPVICKRDEPRDAFVSNQYSDFSSLPSAAIVGTSSLRRQCQLKALRPDIKVIPLRGNVNTRLAKLDANEYDAIVLAGVGLKRLGMTDRIRHHFTPTQLLPAVGQGALGIECRVDDHEIQEYISLLNDKETWQCVMAERTVNQLLNGSCQIPIAVYGILQDDQLHLQGLVGNPDGTQLITHELTGECTQFKKIGENLAQGLLSQGADEILKNINHD